MELVKKSFDGVVPKGVLKRGWCRKWLHDVPCVVLNVVDCTDGAWIGRKHQTLEREHQESVSTLRQHINTHDRETSVMTILIVDNTCDSSDLSDYAHALRNGVARSVYALRLSEVQGPSTQRATATTQRVMRSIRYHANACYSRLLRKYRVHKSRCDRRTQAAMVARYMFKMGYCNEFLGHPDKSIELYRDAYDATLALPVDHDVITYFTVKAVCAFISYRMAHILIHTRQVHAAVVQFRKFSSTFMNNGLVSGTSSDANTGDVYEPRHWAWMSENFAEFGALLERCDDELKRPGHHKQHHYARQHRDDALALKTSLDRGTCHDSIYREGYYYDYASRLTARRTRAYDRVARSETTRPRTLSSCRGQAKCYQVTELPTWLGGRPIVTLAQASTSDLSPTLYGESSDNGTIGRRRRGATADMTSTEGGRPKTISSSDHVVVVSSVPNPFECLESDVVHAQLSIDHIHRVRVAQALFPPASVSIEGDRSPEMSKEDEEIGSSRGGNSDCDVSVESVAEWLTPVKARVRERHTAGIRSSSHAMKSVEDERTEKTLTVSKDQHGNLGIRFDTDLRVLAVSPWAKKFGVRPGQTLLSVAGVRLESVKDLVKSIPKHNRSFSLKILPEKATTSASPHGATTTQEGMNVDDDEGNDEDVRASRRHRRRTALDLDEARGHLRAGDADKCLAKLRLPLEIVRLERWPVLLAVILDLVIRASLAEMIRYRGSATEVEERARVERCVELVLELASPALLAGRNDPRRARVSELFCALLNRHAELKSSSQTEPRVFAVRRYGERGAVEARPFFDPPTADAGDVVSCHVSIVSWICLDRTMRVKRAKLYFNDAEHDLERVLQDEERLVLARGEPTVLTAKLHIAKSRLFDLRLVRVDVCCDVEGVQGDVCVRVLTRANAQHLDLVPPASGLSMTWSQTLPALYSAPHEMMLTMRLADPDSCSETVKKTDGALSSSVGGREVTVRFEVEPRPTAPFLKHLDADSSDAPFLSLDDATISLPDFRYDDEQTMRLAVVGYEGIPTTTVKAIVCYKDGNECAMEKSRGISVSFQPALSVSYDFHRTSDDGISSDRSFALNRAVLVHVVVQTTGLHDHDVVLMNVQYDGDNDSTCRVTALPLPALDTESDAAFTLSSKDVFSTSFHVVPTQPISDRSWGRVRIEWKGRDARQETHPTVTYFDMPKVTVLSQPLSVNVRAPTTSCVGVPFSYDIEIRNDSNKARDLLLNVVDDGVEKVFFRSGDTSSHLNVSPHSRVTHRLVLVPLKVGMLALPFVHLIDSSASSSVDSKTRDDGYLSRADRRRVFVSPASP